MSDLSDSYLTQARLVTTQRGKKLGVVLSPKNQSL